MKQWAPSWLPLTRRLEVGRFDSVRMDSTRAFLTTLRKMYNNLAEKAVKDREVLVTKLSQEGLDSAKIEAMRLRYTNERVEDWVRGVTRQPRAVEWDGRIYVTYGPIFNDERRPTNMFDFRADFFVPNKHFLGYYFDTLYFNIAAIWFLTLVLFITLYFDLLKKLVSSLENRRKYRRKNIT